MQLLKENYYTVEILKECRNMLLCQNIIAHTDHLNALNVNTKPVDKFQRWRLLLEECGEEIRHIKGGDNVVADALSSIKTHEINNEEKEHLEALKQLNAMRLNNVKSCHIDTEPHAYKSDAINA